MKPRSGQLPRHSSETARSSHAQRFVGVGGREHANHVPALLEPRNRLADLADRAALERELRRADHRLVAEVHRLEAERRRSRRAPRSTRPRSRRASPSCARRARTRPPARGARPASPIGSPATSAVPPITPVGEERLAARREEVALVAAQREVGEAVAAVLLHELGGALAIVGLGRRDRERPEPQPERAERERRRPGSAARSRSAPSRRRCRPGTRPASGAQMASASPTCTSGSTVVGIARRDELRGARANSAARSTRWTVASSKSRPFARCATAERDHERDRELPGAALPPREAAREPDQRRARVRARASARRAGTPGGSTPWTSRMPVGALRASAPRRSRRGRRTSRPRRGALGVAGRRTVTR